jgi:hypothetical protein
MSPILGIIASSFRSAAGPDGAYDALATVTVPSGGLASIDFAGIPNTYKHLQVRYINTTSTVNQNLIFRFNGDTGSNYAWHRLLGDGSSAIADGVSATTGMSIGRSGGNTTSFAAGVVDILDYTSTSKNKTVRTLYGTDQNGSGLIFLGSGLWFKTPEAVNTFTMISAAGNFAQHSQFALYGVK